MGLLTSTTVKGVTDANEINKYFQNSYTAYNTGDVGYLEYKVSTSNIQDYSYNY